MLRARGRGGVEVWNRELGRRAAGVDILEVWRSAAGVLPLFASRVPEL